MRKIFKNSKRCNSSSATLPAFDFDPIYSGAGAVLFAVTNSNGANTTISIPIVLHNGAGMTGTLKVSGGSKTSPAIEISLPVALPANSTMAVWVLELF